MYRLLLPPILLICIITSTPAGALELENVNLEDWAIPWQQDWAYQALDHFSTKGYLPGKFYLERPITEREFAEVLDHITRNIPPNRLDELDNYYLQRLSKLLDIYPPSTSIVSAEEGNIGYLPGYLILGEDDGIKYHLGGNLVLGGILYRRSLKEDTLFAGLGIFGGVALGERILLHYQMRVRRVFRDEPHPFDFPADMINSSRDWAGFLPAVEQAYINLDLKYLTLEVGRDRLVWGPGYCSGLLLSLNQPSMDFFRLRTGFGRITFESFAAAVDPPTDTFLSGHRVTVRVTDRIALSASEVLFFAEQGIMVQYFNPIIPYYILQWNQKDKDNILWSLDGEYRPFDGLRLYGEFLIDDFQYESVPQGAPNKLGFSIGGQYIPAFLPSLDLHVEYTRANRYTYTHIYERNRYINKGRCIGFWLGPDADQLFVQVSYFISPWLSTHLFFDRQRKGEGTIDETWQEGINAKGLPFPSGIVETSNAFGCVIEGEPLLWRMDYSLGIRYESIKNLFNQQGVSRNLIRFFGLVRFNL